MSRHLRTKRVLYGLVRQLHHFGVHPFLAEVSELIAVSRAIAAFVMSQNAIADVQVEIDKKKRGKPCRDKSPYERYVEDECKLVCAEGGSATQ